jgi:ADP-ribose pyrophosphatase YjhB (NUDIX family)
MDQSHNLAAGVILLENNRVLLVKDKNGWCFPKGTVEIGELFEETAIRECREETGFEVDIIEAAFITEYRSQQWGQYLQIYYLGKLKEKENTSQDKKLDDDILEVRFVPFHEVENLIGFKPWVEPFKEWLQNRRLKHYKFELI